MSDLIKARKGIFIPDITVEMFRNASLEAVEELLVSGEMQDIILPSAEPERLTDDDFETIRIHLNAQKEKLCNQQRWEEAEEYQRIIDRFMAFASAEPDSQPTCNNLQPTCNNLATDTISRQVAIDAVNKIAPVNTEYDCRLLDILDVRYVLTELPSADFIIKGIVDEEYLTDWYINSVDNDQPIWTEEHIRELMGDFYLIPKEKK